MNAIIDGSTRKEFVVPNGIEDFGLGDRIWFQSSKTLSLTFGTVVSINRDTRQMSFRTDDKSYAVITEDEDTTTKGYPTIDHFYKSLNVNSLSVGDRISTAGMKSGNYCTRVYARVTSVNPGVSIGITFEPTSDKQKGSGKEHLVQYHKNGDTIEYQMAGWELEG